ncbi:MAG TPA: VOC family protein [Capillimicrobium sp.]|nr:VOC family protein [Capillimicrobium sp.]
MPRVRRIRPLHRRRRRRGRRLLSRPARFAVDRRPGPGFAVLSRGPLRLLLSEPRGPGGAAQPAADGARPQPGGWNRIQLEVDDLPARVEALRAAGVRLRGDVVHGRGGDQVLVDDPSGNAVELFQPAR